MSKHASSQLAELKQEFRDLRLSGRRFRAELRFDPANEQPPIRDDDHRGRWREGALYWIHAADVDTKDEFNELAASAFKAAMPLRDDWTEILGPIGHPLREAGACKNWKQWWFLLAGVEITQRDDRRQEHVAGAWHPIGFRDAEDLDSISAEFQTVVRSYPKPHNWRLVIRDMVKVSERTCDTLVELASGKPKKPAKIRTASGGALDLSPQQRRIYDEMSNRKSMPVADFVRAVWRETYVGPKTKYRTAINKFNNRQREFSVNWDGDTIRKHKMSKTPKFPK